MARALLIEDCARTRRLLTRILALEGHTVTVAADGVEGLRALGDSPPGSTPFDLVVTELVMPGNDGFEAIRAAWALPQRPKILVVDHPFARGAVRPNRHDYLRMTLELGADRVLANPVRLRTLARENAALLAERVELRRAG
jgi:CheY-like chemotaxis protein